MRARLDEGRPVRRWSQHLNEEARRIKDNREK